MKYGHVYLLTLALEKLNAIEAKQPNGVLAFPGDARLKLCGLIIDVQAAMAKFNASRTALVKQFGAPLPDGSCKVEEFLPAASGEPPLPNPKYAAFLKEHNKLFEAETELKLEPLAMADLVAAQLPMSMVVDFVALGLATR